MRTTVFALLMTAALATPGCSIFRTKVPDYALYVMPPEDSQDWAKGGLDHPDVWARNLAQSVVNAGVNPIMHAHWPIDGSIVSVRSAG